MFFQMLSSVALGYRIHLVVTAPFNNMQTLKFKAQPTAVEHAVIKSLCTVQTRKQCSAVVVSWEDPPNI